MPKRKIIVPVDGSRLRIARERLGYTQRELSRLAGLGEQTVWRMEHSASDPSVDAVARIARVLRVSMDFLMGLTDQETGQLSENSNTPDEQRIVDAFRAGGWSGAGKLIFDRLTEQSDKGSKIPGDDTSLDTSSHRRGKRARPS